MGRMTPDTDSTESRQNHLKSLLKPKNRVLFILALLVAGFGQACVPSCFQADISITNEDDLASLGDPGPTPGPDTSGDPAPAPTPPVDDPNPPPMDVPPAHLGPGLQPVSAVPPEVTGVTGEIRNGASLQIQGVEFGPRNGRVFSWDDFEGTPLNSSLNGAGAKIGPDWQCTHECSTSVTVKGDRAHSGSRSAHVDWRVYEYPIAGFGWTHPEPGNAFRRMYISYWRWMEGAYQPNIELCSRQEVLKYGDCNQKHLFVSGDTEGKPQLLSQIEIGSDSWSLYNNVDPLNQANLIPNQRGLTYSNTSAKWGRWEYYLEMNTGNCVRDGVAKFWVDGQQAGSRLDYPHNCTANANAKWKDLYLGLSANGFTASARAWFDDVYVATTQSRVEICDTPRWSDCRHREIQIVNEGDWESGRIQITLRQGSFSTLSGRYLYVIKDNGLVNEAGYRLD